MLKFLTCALLLAAGIAVAELPPRDLPASPRSLPMDNLPPFRMLDEHGRLVPLPAPSAGALHRTANAPLESSAAGPPLAAAVAAASAAVDACKTAGYRVGATVIDSAGEARAMLTADGSDGSHVFVAMRKALTALEFGIPSSEAGARVADDPAQLRRVRPNMFVMGGALPIRDGERMLGAIGVSGAGGMPWGHQDEVCAAAGLRVLQHGG